MSVEIISRRRFLFRAGAAAAIAIINPAELIEQLAPKRLFFPSIELAPASLSPFNGRYTTVAELQRAYRRSTTKLYRAYSQQIPEYAWFARVPDEVIQPLGREVRIPLRLRA